MQELLKSLVKAQVEIQPPKKTGENKHLKNKYATLDDIYWACRSALALNGLVISHDVENREGRDWLVTHLIHISGERISNHMPLFSMQSNNQSQGFAGGLTYARRYAVCCLLALPSDDDDDGESLNGTNKPPVAIVEESAKQEMVKRKEAVIKEIDKNLNGNVEDLSVILKPYNTNNLYSLDVGTLSKIANQTQMRKK